ncbi:MAG: bifunctional UDP-N-acetylglucosamine diphosphorylase/glucosamine-1-phosphate N-acetyltransferase GlmU [Pseudomonadota bacterium]
MTSGGSEIAVVVLAGGRGSRMDSDLPKVLHQLGGAPMLHHVMKTALALDPARLVVVTGFGADAVGAAAQAFHPETVLAHQAEQIGTANAVQAAEAALQDFAGQVIVIYGDTPLVFEDTYRAALTPDHELTLLAFEAADPGRYGRVIASADSVDKIVEAADATSEELSVTLCNSGVLSAPASTLFELVGAVDNKNAAGEYYLTDIAALARKRGLTVGAVRGSEREFLGINTLQELATAEAAFQARQRANLIDAGVLLEASDTLFCAFDAAIGRGARVEPYVVIGPGVTVESGAVIRAFSHLEGAHVSAGASVGPYARLRPGAELAEDVRIGNFVEVKNAEIAQGAKVNHLSYVGDASIGPRSNLGAGTITCNYDGVFKHRTEIGAEAFIGSNTMLVAPVSVGDGAVTGSGSVITKDVPEGDLALGRSHQVNKSGLGRRLMAHLRARKAKGNQ